jgi:vanillate/3-O-methylgallate O-demethylase
MNRSVSRLRMAPEDYAWSRLGEPEYTDRLDESLSWKESCSVHGHAA